MSEENTAQAPAEADGKHARRARGRKQPAQEREPGVEPDFNPAEFEQNAAQATALTQQVAAATAMPTERREEITENGETQAPRQPEQREWAKTAKVISVPTAKMAFHFDYERHKAAITFDDGKPSLPVRQAMKDNGFSWNNDDSAWEKPIKFPTREQDRANAIATFNEVAEMRHQEMGVGQQR